MKNSEMTADMRKRYKKILAGIEDAYDRAGSRYFDLFHDDIEKHQADRELLDQFVSMLPDSPVVCDMGCGPAAQYGGDIQEKCGRVIGLDLSRENLRLAAEARPELEYLCADMSSTGMADNSLDGIICFYALFHIPREICLSVFSEFKRLLKPDGILLLVTHKGEYKNTFTELWGQKDLSLFAHFHLEEEIAELAADAGLSIIALDSKESYYDFPKERIVLLAKNDE